MKPKIAIQWVEAHVGFTTCFQGFYGLSFTNLPRTWVVHGRIESPWNEPSRQHPARRFQPGDPQQHHFWIDALPTPHTVDGSEIPTNHLGWLKLKTLQYHGRSSSSLVVGRILEPSTVPRYIKCFKVQSNYSVACIQYASCWFHGPGYHSARTVHWDTTILLKGNQKRFCPGRTQAGSPSREKIIFSSVQWVLHHFKGKSSPKLT